MELYYVLVFVHIAVLVFAFGLTGAIHASEWLMAQAATVQDMRALGKPQKWGMFFGPVVALMLLIGAWLVMLSDDRRDEYTFGDGWIWTGALVLVLAFAAGIGIHAPHGQKLGMTLAKTPDGPPTPEIMAMIREPVPWVDGHAVPFMILAVASNMVNKPGTPVSILVIVVGAVVGSLIGLVGKSRVPA
jgi:hypothetical protein